MRLKQDLDRKEAKEGKSFRTKDQDRRNGQGGVKGGLEHKRFKCTDIREGAGREERMSLVTKPVWHWQPEQFFKTEGRLQSVMEVSQWEEMQMRDQVCWCLLLKGKRERCAA